MGYKEQIIDSIEKYFRDVLPEYKETTVAAMKDGRKLSLFKKKDFEGHIAGFTRHKDDAMDIMQDAKGIDVPEDEEKLVELKEKLMSSIVTFTFLCDNNIALYSLMDRNQKKDKTVDMREFKTVASRMNKTLDNATNDLNRLETAYNVYMGNAKPEAKEALEEAIAEERAEAEAEAKARAEAEAKVRAEAKRREEELADD
ncbi:MAG TPA: hypothetical protein VJY37_05205 [Anaerovoracaceae bacterium]|nr:hypothetical protein [Anaerovoracaceae bacterium]